MSLNMLCRKPSSLLPSESPKQSRPSRPTRTDLALPPPPSLMGKPTSSSAASSSGVSEMSDSGVSSAARRLSSLDEAAEESETSDYQRSTPSPRDDLSSNASSVGSSFKQGTDPGLGDEIEIKLEEYSSPPSLILPGFTSTAAADLVQAAAAKMSSHSKSKKKRSKRDKKLKFPRKASADPKILMARVNVHKLSVTPSMISNMSAVSVSPKKEKRKHEKRSRMRNAEDNVHSWFAKRTCPSPPSTPEKKPCGLIRPAVLTVKSPSAKQGGMFSSSDSKQRLNNPFLPAGKATSYLFGGGDEFEEAAEELVIDEEDIASEEDEEAEKPKDDKKDDYEAEAPSLQEVDRLIAKDLAEAERREKEQQELIIVKEASVIFTKKVIEETPNKIRFPAPLRRSHSNMIECKWKNCQMNFTSYGKLSDHLKAFHVVGQLYEQQQHLEANPGSDETYECMWETCKVFGKKSCSGSWLEKHVPVHGGKFAFACIVDGCKLRFSSQHMLQRHVNSHFSASDAKNGRGGSGSNAAGNKKTDAQSLANTLSESSKNLKRAGIKLKFRRHNVFSARIFDFFDVGIMAGIKHGVSDLEQSAPGDRFTFKAKLMAMRTEEKSGQRVAQVRWLPENILDDEWIPLDQVTETKVVDIASLAEGARAKMGEHIFGKAVTTSPKVTGARRRK